jgi:hypothetical protein
MGEEEMAHVHKSGMENCREHRIIETENRIGKRRVEKKA